MFVLLLFILFSAAGQDTAVSSWTVDLNGNGKNEAVTLARSDSGAYRLDVDGSEFKLGFDAITPIYDQNGVKHEVVLADLKSDSTREILIAGHTSDKSEISSLRILRYSEGKINSMIAQPMLGKRFDSVRFQGGFVLYNSQTKSIYVEKGLVHHLSKSGHILTLHKVVLYKWDTQAREIIEAGWKLFWESGKRNLVHEMF